MAFDVSPSLVASCSEAIIKGCNSLPLSFLNSLYSGVQTDATARRERGRETDGQYLDPGPVLVHVEIRAEESGLAFRSPLRLSRRADTSGRHDRRADAEHAAHKADSPPGVKVAQPSALPVYTAACRNFGLSPNYR